MFQVAPVEVSGDERRGVAGLRCQRMALGEPDESGRRRPEPVPGSELRHPVRCRHRSGRHRASDGRVRRVARGGAGGRARVDPRTLQGAVPWLFAAGDVVTGPSDIARAIGQGRRAAFMIDRWLQGLEPGPFEGFDDRLAVVDKAEVLRRQKSIRASRVPRWRRLALVAGPRDFAEPRARRSPRRRRGRPPGAAWTAASARSATSASPPAPPTRSTWACAERISSLDVGAVIVATGYGSSRPISSPSTATVACRT